MKVMVEISSDHEGLIMKFINFCAWFDRCCSAGHSASTTINVDGDGRCDLSFDFGDLQKDFTKLKDQYKKDDPKAFNFD